MSNLLQRIRPYINQDYIIVNPDGTKMSRRDISEHLGLSYSYGCKLLRGALGNWEIAESKLGPHTMFIANPFVLCDNPQATPTLTALFKGRCAE